MSTLIPITPGFDVGCTFSHPELPTLYVAYAPVEVDWTYNLITMETNTYAGQVVQVLGVNFDRFTISGRFGRDGYEDYQANTKDSAATAMWWERKNAPSFKDSKGLTQMWTWFRSYMSIASQGISSGGSLAYEHYDQQPVTITYEGASHTPVDDNKSETTWRVYPINFPSFRIANDNFAPEWRVECQVYEAPRSLGPQIMQEAIKRLAYEPIYTPGNKFSDPNPHDPRDSQKKINQAALDAYESTLAAADFFMLNLPNFPPEDLSQMIIQGYSMPNIGNVPQHTKTDEASTDPFKTGGIAPDLAGLNDTSDSAGAVFPGSGF